MKSPRILPLENFCHACLLVSTHPKFKSCSTSSSQTRTCKALPSRTHPKMSSKMIGWKPGLIDTNTCLEDRI
uniref:Ovule protein n=1 Tax=Romanomermis culicivorax TaxID=13658 RepID=A0A915L419_ROMCU